MDSVDGNSFGNDSFGTSHSDLIAEHFTNATSPPTSMPLTPRSSLTVAETIPSPPTGPPPPISATNNELGSMIVVLSIVPRVEVRRSHRIASLPPVNYCGMCN
jgi:hypothetical protein